MAASAAAAAGGRVIGKNGSSSWIRIKDRKGLDRNGTNKVCCHSSPAVLDPYKTLRIYPGASESEVKKAFRQLALQYHPDVCRGSNCLVQFQEINHAYDVVPCPLQTIQVLILISMFYILPDGYERLARGKSSPGDDGVQRGR